MLPVNTLRFSSIAGLRSVNNPYSARQQTTDNRQGTLYSVSYATERERQKAAGKFLDWIHKSFHDVYTIMEARTDRDESGCRLLIDVKDGLSFGDQTVPVDHWTELKARLEEGFAHLVKTPNDSRGKTAQEKRSSRHSRRR
jgi:hypothetical protein